jgi:hypothetical protein
MSNQLDPETESQLREFSVKDCALIALATGRRAQNLKELREILLTTHPGSIYYHFWGGLLHTRFEEPEYANDFAAWARHSLHDTTLAERLGVLDPTAFEDMEALRQELVEIVEERIDESEFLPWTKRDEQFEFIRSQIAVFDTHRRFERPEELVDAISHMATSSIFYHFIDARRRSHERNDDFRAWLGGFGAEYAELCDQLNKVDPYFKSLTQLRDQLTSIFTSFFRGE